MELCWFAVEIGEQNDGIIAISFTAGHHKQPNIHNLFATSNDSPAFHNFIDDNDYVSLQIAQFS